MTEDKVSTYLPSEEELKREVECQKRSSGFSKVRCSIGELSSKPE